MNQPLWNPPLLAQREKPMIQEYYFPDRWKMLICCLMLNLTSRKQVDPIIDGFFEKWPDAESASKAEEEKMKEYLKSLGMYNRRAKTIIKMSKQFLEGFTDAKQLHGCGKYANDSDRIFYKGLWRDTEPTDGALVSYKKFLVGYYEK